MKLALLLMLWLAGGATVSEPARAGWSSPNTARPGREAPAVIDISCAGCSSAW